MTDRSTTEPAAPAAAETDTRVHPATAATAAPDGAVAARPHDPYAPDDGWEDDWADHAPEETLPERPRRRLVTPATVVLAGVVLAGAGFLGGVEVQKHSGGGGAAGAGGFAARAGLPGGQTGARGQGAAAPTGTGAPGAQAGGQDGAAGPGATGGATGGSGATVGTVANVKGSKLYVTGTDGTTVEVTVGDQATVSRLSKSSVGGVHPGDSVVVQGTAKSDGAITATSVQAAANGLSLGGGGFGARPGSGSSGSSGGSGSSSSGGSDAVDQLFGGG